MAYPRLRFLLPLLLVLGAGFTMGPPPVGFPTQSREPPLADDVIEAVRADGRFDPDDPHPIERTQYIVPATGAPRTLPGELSDGVVPVQYTQPIAVGELPTPLVTLNIEGNDVSPSGQAVIYKLHVKN